MTFWHLSGFDPSDISQNIRLIFHLVVRNTDSLFYVREKRWLSILLVYLLVRFSASAEVKTALAQAFLNGIYLILWTYRGSV